jgi:hypothetical protein
MRSVREFLEGPKLPFDFGERTLQLLASGIVRGALELPAQLCKSQAQRFSTPQLFGIVLSLRHCAPRALFFVLVHPLLDTVLCVD